MKTFNLFKLFILFVFTAVHIIPAETIYFEYDEPTTEGSTNKSAERWRLNPNRLIRPELTNEQLEKRVQLKELFEQRLKKTDAAKKIQNVARGYQTRKSISDTQRSTAQKITALTRQHAAIKIQRNARAYLKEKHFEQFTSKLAQFADQSYQEFKTLVCTGHYINQTDWLYRFIETMEAQEIFVRKNGRIESDEFLPKFTEKIKGPKDWLEEKILKYLTLFHAAVYETFIDKAAEQVTKYKTSWTDAVSIPAPKDYYLYSPDEDNEGKLLYPKVYTCRYCPNIHLVLGKIFSEIFEKDPTRFEQLNISPKITPTGTAVQNTIDSRFAQDFEITLFGNTNFITIIHDYADPAFIEPAAIMEQIKTENTILNLLDQYLKMLGLELSPEEESLESMIANEYFKPEEPILNSSDTTKMWQQRWNNYLTKLEKFEDEQQKFIDDHINWAWSAYQTLLLGQIIFDKNLHAFDELGGKAWLDTQPEDIQKILTEQIDKIKNAPKRRTFVQKLIRSKPVHAKSRSRYAFVAEVKPSSKTKE